MLDLPQNNNNNDKVSTIKFRLYLAELSDVNIDNFPKPEGATILTNPLLPNPLTGKIKIPVMLEGISRQTLAWVNENAGKRVIAVWERCSDGQKFIASGGLLIKLNKIGGLDGGLDGVALDLEGGDCPEPFCFYDGEIVRETPVTVNLGSNTTFALAQKSQYILADNTSAKKISDITNVTDSDVGRIVELQGAGVNHPTTIDSSEKFILKNGLSFTANVGSSISFQITKTENGYAFL